jgi:4-amino-4-deoxy-L-arabinose transferase-like glycosyltransferase
MDEPTKTIMASELTTQPARHPSQATAKPGRSSVVGQSAAAGSRRNYVEWAVLLALVVIMLAQLWTSITRLSITSDEIDHVQAAYRYWQCNDFGWNPEHPPLVKMVAAVPLLFMHVNDPIPQACGLPDSKADDFIVGHAFVFANPESMLTASRMAASIFSVILLLTVWFFARAMFGFPVAVLSGILVAFDPTFLAHGALVTTDVAASAGILLAVYAAYRYVLEPNVTRTLALGLAVGFAFCLKHSTILLAAIVPVLLLANLVFFDRAEFGPKLRRVMGALLVVAVVSLTVLWACYGFRYAARPGDAAIWGPPRLSHAHGTMAIKVIPQLQSWHVLPQAYLVGLQDVLVESELGRSSFLLGKLYRNGAWFYFPVAASIKFTVPVLLMMLVSAFSVAFWKRHRRDLMFLIVPAIIFLGFSMSSKLSIGVRHLLPILAFMMIFGCAGVWALAQNRQWMRVTVIALLLYQATTSLHAYPNYLSYANELWGGPGEAYRYLANSDVDWGQAQMMARDYIAKTHPANCFFLRTYNNKNRDYGIPCGGISEIQWDKLETPFTGTLIVSASMVDGIGVRGASIQTHHTFADKQPTAKLGGSALLVYEGTTDVSPIVAAQLILHAREIGNDDPQQALDLGLKAAALDPTSGDAHVITCGAYHTLGDIGKAQQECDLALSLIRKDPQYGPEQIKYLEEFITRNGLQVH